MKWLLAALLTITAFTAAARIELHQFDNPEQEARYNRLIDELRCLVCQNQNLADSNAELAHDLRQQTYEMIKRGASDREVIDFMVARYGDFVLYRPPVKPTTALLWAGPFLILLIGLWVLVQFVRRQRRDSPQSWTEQDQARAKALLEETKGG